jgi:hypothetical protein
MVQKLGWLSALFALAALAACAAPPANPPPATASVPSAPRATSAPAPTAIPAAPTASSPAGPAAESKPGYPGIWGIWGSGISARGRPWLKGHIVTVGWNEIEPADGQLDWTKLDRNIAKVTREGLYVMALVYGGRRSPEWIYAAGVPRVETDVKGGASFPYYLSDANGDGDGDDPGEFRFYFKRMIAAVAQHLDELNNDDATDAYHRILGVQGPVGASGDPQPYERESTDVASSNGWFGEGTPYAISKDEWIAYQQEMFLYYYDQYQATSPRIHTLLNIGDDAEMHAWGLANLPGAWQKYGRVGDRYQRNREYGDPSASSGSWLWEPVREFRDGVAHRSRAEMDLTSLGWFTAAPVWNMYWTNLWDLHTGLDMHNIVEEDLENPAYVEAFTFFSKYAGYKDPRDSIGAWVALRDGLDAGDTARFPEHVYGLELGGRNEQRFQNIVDAFAPYGARQDDPKIGNKTSYDALNDVGWRIYPGNYQLWLYQIDPDTTSQGLWRVGPKDQPYGRFARRFDNASGKNAMYFDIDDRFFFEQPLEAAYPITIRVVYLDEGVGRWALQYDARDDRRKTALVVDKLNSGRWKEAAITIDDGYFGGRGERTSDLSLVSMDGEDDTFHMIEITRATGFRTGYFGDKREGSSGP